MNKREKIDLAKDPNTTLDILADLAKEQNCNIKNALLSNISTKSKILKEIADQYIKNKSMLYDFFDVDDLDIYSLIIHKNTSLDINIQLYATDEMDGDLDEAFAAAPNVNKEILTSVCEKYIMWGENKTMNKHDFSTVENLLNNNNITLELVTNIANCKNKKMSDAGKKRLKEMEA